MKIQLSRISILQSAKIVTALNAVFGLVYTLLGIPLIVFGTGPLRTYGIIYLFGPVFTAIFGFIGFCIAAAIYNALATRIGGIEFDIKLQAPAVNLPPVS